MFTSNKLVTFGNGNKSNKSPNLKCHQHISMFMINKLVTLGNGNRRNKKASYSTFKVGYEPSIFYNTIFYSKTVHLFKGVYVNY